MKTAATLQGVAIFLFTNFSLMALQTGMLPKDGNGTPIQGTFQTIADNRKTVTTAGTAVQLLTASTECKRLDVQAMYKNTDIIAVGSSTVLAGNATDSGNTRRGVILQPGGSFTFYLTDVSSVYIDSVVNGEGVTFVYFD